jgi:hypothetical protein
LGRCACDASTSACFDQDFSLERLGSGDWGQIIDVSIFVPEAPATSLVISAR